MNPVLLKPGSDTDSQLIVLGQGSDRDLDAQNYRAAGQHARLASDVVVGAYRDHAARFDMVICEGGRSPSRDQPARDRYCQTLGCPRRRRCLSVLVGDIDRGGVFAAFVGTLAVLDPGRSVPSAVGLRS